MNTQKKERKKVALTFLALLFSQFVIAPMLPSVLAEDSSNYRQSNFAGIPTDIVDLGDMVGVRYENGDYQYFYDDGAASIVIRPGVNDVSTLGGPGNALIPPADNENE